MHFKKAIWQNIFWRGLYLGSSFAVNVFVSRLLSAGKTGDIFYTVNNISLLLLITGFSLESGMAFYLAKKQATPFQMARFAVLYSVAASVACIYFFQYFFPVAKNKLPPLLAFAFGTILTTFFSGLFSAMQNFKLPNIVLLMPNCLLILCLTMFGFEATLDLKIYNFYFATFGLQGVSLAIVFFVTYRKTETQITESNKHILGLVFRYSVLALIANIIYFLLYRIDYWFVNKYCTAADLGNYIQASKLGQLFLSIPSIVGASIFALVAAQTDKNPFINVLKVARIVLGLATVVMLGLICAGKWLFPFIFGSSFGKMYTTFVLLAPGTLAICFLYPITAYFSGIKMIGVNIAGTMLALIVLIVLDVIFIPEAGINAAAAVSSIGYCLYTFYVTRFFCRKNNISFTSIFEIGKIDFKDLPTTRHDDSEQ